jgi:hypothetical protein
MNLSFYRPLTIHDAYQLQWNQLRGAYQDLYLRYLQARRDYPYFEHEKPPGFGMFSADELRRIQQDCEREFARTV